jgi:GTPase SAR1 family protein
VTVSDVMDELEFGPNGGLMYCMEYLADNLDWLREKLGDFEEDYLIIDCPGQIELYTHSSVMKRIVDFLHKEMNYKMVTLYLLDSNFVGEASKFVAGTLMCLASMVHFEMPHLNILTKVDLLGKAAYTTDFDKYLEVNVPNILADDQNTSQSSKFVSLSEAIGELLDQWNLVNFVPLDITNQDCISDLLAHIDNATQYGENEEPHEPSDEEAPDF